MSNYLWYFHCNEEGTGSIGGMFFNTPYKSVNRIPVTPKMLTEFANSKIILNISYQNTDMIY